MDLRSRADTWNGNVIAPTMPGGGATITAAAPAVRAWRSGRIRRLHRRRKLLLSFWIGCATRYARASSPLARPTQPKVG